MENFFNNYKLTDEQVLNIIERNMKKINENSKINGIIDEDLKQEIITEIYSQLTKGRRKK